MVGGMLQLQSLLRSRPPESEIEIELERTWEASIVDLEMVWPEFDNNFQNDFVNYFFLLNLNLKGLSVWPAGTIILLQLYFLSIWPHI